MTEDTDDDRVPLWIVGVAGVSRGVVDLAADAAAEMGVDARVHPEPVDVTVFEIVEDEEPYPGLTMAEWVLEETGHEQVLAVTDYDVEKPRGEPAYALAMVNGPYGIASTARLGEPGDGDFTDRFRTVVAQHVGYYLGNRGCRTEGCLFDDADSMDVAEIDGIGPGPCEECQAEMRETDSPLLPDGGGEVAAAGIEDRSHAWRDWQDGEWDHRETTATASSGEAAGTGTAAGTVLRLLAFVVGSAAALALVAYYATDALGSAIGLDVAGPSPLPWVGAAVGLVGLWIGTMVARRLLGSVPRRLD